MSKTRGVKADSSLVGHSTLSDEGLAVGAAARLSAAFIMQLI